MEPSRTRPVSAASPNGSRSPSRQRARATNDPFYRARGSQSLSQAGQDRRRRDLVAIYIEALGGIDAVSDLKLVAIRKAAELTVAAETTRSIVLSSSNNAATLDALVKVEGEARRAIRALGIKPEVPRSPRSQDASHPVGTWGGKGANTMSEADAAVTHQQLRVEAAKLLGLNADDLTVLQALQADLCGLLMLEVDNAQAAQLSGGRVDIGRLGEAVKILKSLLPPTAVEARPDYQNEFADALPTFKRIVEQQVTAIEAREVHVSEILTRERDALKAENAELRNQLADAKYLDHADLRPTPPQQTSP
jgi:ribosomal protein S21